MSTTQLKIANQAIYDVGGNPITDIPDGNLVEGLLIDTYWQQALDYVLGEYPWQYFKKWIALTKDTGYTFIDETYEYAYELPSDWARKVETEDQSINYAIRSNRILSNVDDMEIAYIAIPTITTKDTVLNWPSHFVQALVKRLAYHIAPKLKAKGARGRDFHNEYLGTLSLSIMRDANEDNESSDRKTKHSTYNDSWIQSMG